MKKVLLSTLALFCLNFSSTAQVVDYLIPVGDLIGMTVNTGDFCFDASEYKQASIGNTWGFTWTSTNANTPVSINVDFVSTIDPGLTIPTTLNANADVNAAMTASSCGFTGQLFSMNPANYNPLGLNTVMLDYSAAVTVAQIYPVIGAYAHVEVNYGSTCTDPDVPTLTASSPICPGSSATINIAGNLNDATTWEIYSTSCGTGSAGSTAGSSIVLTPASTTTYFVRGEGGCVTPGLCESITITVEDNDAPVADVPTLTPVNAECSANPSPPTATDNCVGAVAGTPDVSLPITTQGTTILTWTYDDGNGNTSTQTQSVTVNDATAPVADVPTLTPFNAECSANPSPPTATDNCLGAVAGTPDVSLPITTQGTTTLTWTYDDGNGNTSTQTQSVTVNDATTPVADVLTLTPVNAECSATPSPPTATDNCVGAVAGTPDVSLPITTQGTTTITWTYDDGNGNASTQTQSVTVNDATAPVADLPTLTPVNAECSANPSPPTATDNCVGAVAGTPDVSLPITTQGTTTLTWTYDDGNGNTSTQTQTVNLNDVTVPVISSCPTNSTISADNVGCTSQVVWLSPTATDNCGSVTLTSSHNSGDTFPLGTTSVTYAATDDAGNMSTCTFNITVVSDLIVTTDLVTDVDCFDNSTGAIDVTTAGTGTPYTYDWNSGAFTTEDISGLMAGTYDFTVTDAFGCTAIASETISEPTAMSVVVDGSADPSSCGATDGTINTTVSGGTPAYTFDWNSGTLTTEDITTLAAGVYNLVATDMNGCTVSTSVTLSDPGAPNISIASFDNVSCNGEMDGAIDIDVSGGAAPYTFDWNSGSFTTEDLSGLGAGTYDLTLTDGSGCSASISQTITEPAAIDVSVTQSEASLTANASGLTYQWIDCADDSEITGAISQTFEAATNGTYAVVIADGVCSDTSNCSTIEGLSINETDQSFHVYPNPSKDIIYVSLDGHSNDAVISILDMNGKEVYFNPVTSFKVNNKTEVDISHLERGTYLVCINFDDQQRTELIVVE